MKDIKSEIARVEKVIAETKSPYLKKDYEKYLKKLRNKQKQSTVAKISNNKISVEDFKNKNYNSDYFDDYEKIIINETVSLL